MAQVGPCFHLKSKSSSASMDERRRGMGEQRNFIGVQANETSAKWFWNHHFAAVAGDTYAFEAWPPQGTIFHEYLLSFWGTPIGEMWDMETLSKQCESHNRWSFFLTSAPLHVIGGIGSPPGAIAIF